MKFATLLSACLPFLCLFLSSSVALNVVPIAISKSPRDGQSSRYDRLKRAVIAEALDNEISLYAANISVGTPPQPITVLLDTGSSDTYVMASTANDCETGQCSGGTFDSSKSSTFKTVLKGGFQIKYQSGDTSSGDYISDNLVIGSGTLKSVQMGLAFKTTIGFGLMGIGYDTNEASGTVYPNVIDQLVSQGQINAKVYSLYLDDVEANTGTVLFGGIDQAKYDGQLSVIPIQKDPQTGGYVEFLVTLSSITITNASGTDTVSSTNFNVILDSGTSLTYLPASIVSTLINIFKAVDDTANSGAILVNCDILSAQSSAYATFSFGGSTGAQIKVPMTELILDLDIQMPDPPFPNTCVFGILQGPTDGPYPLGDTFLRSAYVVYDLAHNEIGLAQSNFNADTNSIYEFPASATGIPSLSGAAGSSPTSGTSGSAFAPTLALSIVPPVGSADPSTAKQTVTVQTTVAQTVVGSGTATKSGAAGSPVPPVNVGLLSVCALWTLLALFGGFAFLR